MRFSTVAAAVCLSLSAAAAGVAGVAAAAPAQLADAPAAGPAASGTPAAAPPSEAAAKHAKRTACLKDAKAKKLLGADKTAFLKSCIAAP
jgi:hypothetical protein